MGTGKVETRFARGGGSDRFGMGWLFRDGAVGLGRLRCLLLLLNLKPKAVAHTLL